MWTPSSEPEGFATKNVTNGHAHYNHIFMEIQELSDKDLYARCQEYGTAARVWRRRFAGLLPEVARRELHRRRGHASIYEFAFKLAGMSTASVDKVLHLAERLENKPALLAQLESGSQGWSKIEKVAFIATPETDKDWAEKVEKMGTYALEAFVQIQRGTKGHNVAEFTHVSEQNHKFHSEQWGSMSFPVSPEIEKRLRLMKYQLEKEKGITLTYNEVLQLLMEGGGGKEAQVTIQVCPECAARKAAEVQGRAIPAIVMRVLQAKYRGYCGFPCCARPATSLHHTKRFSLEKGHDPAFIVPLCKIHERLVHSGHVENEEDPPEKWRVLQKPDPSHPKFAIDQKVQSYRTEAIIQSIPT
ncbi:MAG: hypothetical protein AAB383_03955 [Patescibacteria group bacterium]